MNGDNIIKNFFCFIEGGAGAGPSHRLRPKLSRFRPTPTPQHPLTLVFKTKDKPDLLIHAQPVCDPLLDLLQVGLHLDEPQLAPPLDQLVRLHYQQLKEVGILMIFSSFPTTKIHMIQKLPII